MSRPRRVAALLAALCLATPAVVMGNGRFPATVSVQTRPGDDQMILLASTFGLMLSQDAGETFRWVCEDAIGYGGTFDPKYRIAPDGTIFATTFSGLRVSRDDGCSFELVGGMLEGHWVDWIELAPNGEIWVATSSGGKENDVFVSTDGGETFTARGLAQPTIWWKTIRVAPSDPDRVYVSGYRVAQTLPDGGSTLPAAIVKRTADGGETWEDVPLGDFALGNVPQIVLEGVSRFAPDTVYARSVATNGAIGDALYRSDDGGNHWTRILETEDTITAFLLTEPDEDTRELIAGTVNRGVFVSADDGATWSRPPVEPKMACVTRAEDGALLACGANWDPDNFALGRSTDQGKSWSKIVRFSEIAGPLQCPAGTVQNDTCSEAIWPSLADQLGIGAPDAGPGGGANPDAGPGGGGGGGCCSGAPHTPTGAIICSLVIAVVLCRRRREV